MSLRTSAYAYLFALSAACVAVPAFAATANMKTLDPDGDGTVSLAKRRRREPPSSQRSIQTATARSMLRRRRRGEDFRRRH